MTNAVSVNAVVVTNSAPSGYFQLLGSTNPPGMALIPAGSFTIGNQLIIGNSITNDPDITDANPTNVYVSAFYMDVNLVSSNQWTSVYTYATNHGYTFANVGSAKAGNNPGQTVNWYDCVAWCNARSAQAGLTPCYYTDAALTQLYTNATGTSVFLTLTNDGYSLPTEAEWEKAARGGLSGQRFPWGNLIGQSQANYDGAGFLPPPYDFGPSGYNPIGIIGGNQPATSPVGSFPPNGYGLYDMAGNVQEWCWDWYGSVQAPSSPYLGGSNPTGPPGGNNRVSRGGYCGTGANSARCAYRNKVTPISAVNFQGFRCVKGF